MTFSCHCFAALFECIEVLTEYGPNDSTGKQQPKADSYADYLARREAAQENAADPSTRSEAPEIANTASDAVAPTVREGLALMLRPGRRTRTLRS